ncbi:MAG: lipoyl domain-containing protein [bacterium]|nr:lipoyl domain-containing protein [bacterium]MDE0287088.1 lipoyl domain-containing protein [bacterium]MDE0440126.1 lipoyl domain-containing protein [bacterium]
MDGSEQTAGRVPLTVPHMGVVEEVVVIEWLVDAGTLVSAGQEVVIVETEKAEVALEAPAAGTIDIAVTASDLEVAVGDTLAYITP